MEDAVSAKIKGTDADNDLAVVAVQKADIPEDTLNQIKIAQIGSSDDLVVGQQVVAIGNALGYGQSCYIRMGKRIEQNNFYRRWNRQYRTDPDRCSNQSRKQRRRTA